MTVRQNRIVGLAACSMGTLGGMLHQPLRGMARYPDLDCDLDCVAAALSLESIDRACMDLTLGELRLLGVGRTPLMQPALMLLDEPLAGSYSRGLASIKAANSEILKTGCGVILVDHTVDIVASLPHRIALLNLDAKVFDGSPCECLSSPEMWEVYFDAEEVHA